MTDWSKQFPLSSAPDSWALNNLFLRKIEKSVREWGRAG